MKDKFTPDFRGFTKNLCIISVTILVVILSIYLTSQNDSCLYYLGALIGGTVGLILVYYLADVFYQIACEKGYTNPRYFYIAFFLGWIGYLLVVALPDQRLRTLLENKTKDNKLPQSTKQKSMTKKVEPSNIQESWCIVEDNHKDFHSPTTPREHFECALTYTDDLGLRSYLNMVMDNPAMKEYRDTIRGLLLLSKGELRSTLIDILDSM